MKILTVGASPYLLVRNGRMHADVIRRLRAEGHEVTGAAWHHDEGYYLPDDVGVSYFEDTETGEKLCRLFPFLPTSKSADAILYEIMKKVQPDLVISMGDYKEVDFIYSIKAMYPNLFKWIAIFPFDCLWVNEHHRERIEYADYVISTSGFGWANVSNLCNIEGEFIPYGPDPNKFQYQTKPKNEHPVYMISSQNSQTSNIGAFIRSMAQVKDILTLSGEQAIGRVHTNFYDPGDYDLELLVRRHKADNVILPDYFCSIKDGPNDADFAAMYSSADFFVETSVKSATALTMLESMMMGCVPMGMNAGRVGEILSLMPAEYQLIVPYETFLGAHEEEYSVISTDGLAEKVLESKKDIFEDRSKYEAASLAARKVAEQFSNINFLNNLVLTIGRVSIGRGSIAVESF